LKTARSAADLRDRAVLFFVQPQASIRVIARQLAPLHEASRAASGE